MLLQVIAKNIGDVFLRHGVYEVAGECLFFCISMYLVQPHTN